MAVAHERLRYDRISVLVTPPGFQSIKTYSVKDNTVVRFEVVVAARQIDGANRAMFKRTGLFYRDGGSPVKIQGPTWLADQTAKSAPSLDINYSLGASDISLLVKNAAAVSTRWVGYINKTEIQ